MEMCSKTVKLLKSSRRSMFSRNMDLDIAPKKDIYAILLPVNTKN